MQIPESEIILFYFSYQLTAPIVNLPIEINSGFYESHLRDLGQQCVEDFVSNYAELDLLTVVVRRNCIRLEKIFVFLF